MSYIGNGRTLLIFGPNVQDDIIPDGVSNTFTLSQEVPGGYEGNVIVARKRYIVEELITNTTEVEIDGTANSIIVSDQSIAAALSIVRQSLTDNDASNLIISGSTLNDGVHKITSVLYDGSSIVITVQSNLQDETGSTVDLSWGRTSDWEILEPEKDYSISGTGLVYNRIITFAAGYIPSLDDQIYVIHRGEATYNFTPSQNSVGPDQLQTNLRNFVCDRHLGDGLETEFSISQYAVNSKTLLVTVNGVILEGRDPEQPSLDYDWELVSPDNLSIEFSSAPALNAKIRILHLGFSTVARRTSLSPGQTGGVAPGTIDNIALASDSVTSDKIAAGAVENSDIAVDAVTGNKILLENNENLRSKNSVNVAKNLLKMNSNDETVLNSESNLLIQHQGTTRIKFDHINEALISNTDSDISLGTSSNKWKKLYVAGETRLGIVEADSLESNSTINSSGDITTSGNIITSTPGATVSGIDLTALQSQVNSIQTQLTNLLPAGTMLMWMKDAAAPTGWLLCDGQAVSRTIYADLFSAIGTNFGSGDGSTTFNLPDMRQKFPLGKAQSGTGSVWASPGGSIDHTHIGANHTHDISHTHSVPAHYHGMGAGSTLNITNSGNHTTSINHDHSLFNTSLSGGHGHLYNLTAAAGANNLHGHSIHSLTANSTEINVKQDSTSGSGRIMTGTNSVGTDTTRGGHTHTISGSIGSTSIADPSSQHSHSITGTIGGLDGTHSHAIDVPALVANSTSDGTHIHSSANFNGLIGLVTGGVDGNSSLTTGASSSANSGTAGALATTASNPPFLPTLFIIKT